MRKVALLLSLLILIGSAPLLANQIKVIDRPDIPSFLGYAPGQLIVQYKSSMDKASITRSASGNLSVGIGSIDAIAEKYEVTDMRQLFHGATPKYINGQMHDLSRHFVIEFDPQADLEEVYQAYLNDPGIESVEKNGIHAMYATPNDGYFSYQWYHTQANDHDIDSPEAWDIQTGSSNMIIALLDSGTRYFHPDLGGGNASYSNPGASRGNMWINTTELNGSSGVDDDGNGYTDDWIGWDFINGVSNCWSGEDCNNEDNDPRDFNGHGTHTAGIMTMISNDGYGMAGTAGGWNNGSQSEYGNGVKVMILRNGYSYNYGGQEYGVVMMDASASAFYYAANNGAKIASCSWGSSNSGGIGAAADYFIANGGVIVVAAGNGSAEESPDYLNGRGDCISVGATDENDNGASFTTYGTWVDICAPGDNIYSTFHDHADPSTNYWASMGGTSMATPMVAATCGLIWSQNPGWSASQVESQLYTSSDDIDSYLSAKYIGKMGAGRINSYNAVNTGPPPAPVAAFVGSPTSGTEPLTVNFTDQSTGSITDWDWTFGDGGTSTSQSPSYQYTSSGTYTVTLTVTGPGGSDGETKTDYITVNPCVAPTAGFVGSPTSGDYPLNVNFTDQSTNSPTSWSWTFGDGGTSPAQNPSHNYTAAGTYTVSLTATNSCGSDGETKTDYITVTEPSTDYASLPYSTGFESGSFDPYWFTQSSNSEGRIQITSSYTPRGSYHLAMDDNLNGGLYAQNEAWLRLNLAGKSDVDLTFYWKEFSDETHTQDGVYFSDNGGSGFVKVRDLSGGNTTYQQIALDVDALASANGLSLTGTFVVKFQQYDNYGLTTDGMTFDDISVTSNEAPPVANFTGTPTSGVASLLVNFTDASSGATSWSWTFGDGGTSEAQNPSYTYDDPGLYTVVLTATNAFGSDVETKTDYINVTEGGGWTVITYDDFEAGWGTYSDGGGDCARYTGGTYAHQGSAAIQIRDNSGVASSFYHTAGYNVSGYTELEVEFWFIAISMDNSNEDFWVQYYDGSTWQTVASYARSIDFNNGVFYNKVVTISSGSYNFPSNAKLRFMCDASGNRDYVYIDEIEFRGMSGSSAFGEPNLMTGNTPSMPDEFSLSQNYPNPFNPSTTILYALPQEANVRLDIFNIVGQRIITLVNGLKNTGEHSIIWNGRDENGLAVASGVYFYRIQADQFIESKRMMLVK